MLSVDKLNKKIVSLLLSKLEGVEVIYLFGSQATGQIHKSSDIDIAVLAKKKLDPVKRWDIESELANELNNHVDLVDLLNASTVMQNQIINNGICIFDSGKKAVQFEMQITSMYQHLNEERSAILKQHMS